MVVVVGEQPLREISSAVGVAGAGGESPVIESPGADVRISLIRTRWVSRVTDAGVVMPQRIRRSRRSTCVVGENRRTSRSLALRVGRTNRIIDSSCARLDWAQAVSRSARVPRSDKRRRAPEREWEIGCRRKPPRRSPLATGSFVRVSLVGGPRWSLKPAGQVKQRRTRSGVRWNCGLPPLPPS